MNPNQDIAKDISRRTNEEDSTWVREIRGASGERSGVGPTERPGPRARARRLPKKPNNQPNAKLFCYSSDLFNITGL
jgi:hypothetical protein